ncbi:MAG: oligoribonuclease [Gammaproteobacteria bacterium]
MPRSPDNLIWIDLEMTGLDTDNDYIIEIATVITDSQLNTLGEGPNIAIHQDDPILTGMDEWTTRHHNKSGLVERVKHRQDSAAEAERLTLEFGQKFVPANESPMCGNSICQDRRFLHRLMPRLEQYFHYRNLDVSTIKELVQRWKPDDDEFKKESSHMAMADILDSIEELKYYRENFFNFS